MPATVAVPTRLAPLLAAIVKMTLPLPVSVAPLVTDIQAALLEAVREQPDVPMAVIVAVPPEAAAL